MRTSINIASFAIPGGGFPRKESLLKTLASLKDQADVVRIWFNGVQSRPEWIPKEVEVHYDFNKNLTDLGKFYFLQPGSEEYYFTCDDDLIYPKTYVQDMIKEAEEYEAIVTHHGRKLIANPKDYYRSHPAMRCLSEENTDQILDVPGTGVMMFDTRYFNPTNIKESKDRKMSDLTFALEAAKQGRKIVGLSHTRNYIRYAYPPIETTIHETERKNQSRLIKTALEIYKLNYENSSTSNS